MKKLWLMSIIALLFVTVIPCHASEFYEEKSMIYATGSDQETIYKLLQKDSFDFKKSLDSLSLTVVKESISPVYTIDLLEYAETGVINVKPSLAGKESTDNKNNRGNVYIAKTITTQQEFGGNIMFYVEDNVAYSMFFTPSDKTNNVSRYQASCSYADHAVRIQNRLKEDKFVSVYDIKYVIINSVGDFFYISNNKHNTLIPVGYISSDASDLGFTAQVDTLIHVDSDLKTLADNRLEEHKAFIRKKEQWEKEHPGELWDYTGDNSVSPLISGCSQVDNIQNIAEYLNLDLNADVSKPAHSAPNNLRNIIFYCCITLGICITVTGISVIAYRKKCRRK